MLFPPSIGKRPIYFRVFFEGFPKPVCKYCRGVELTNIDTGGSAVLAATSITATSLFTAFMTFALGVANRGIRLCSSDHLMVLSSSWDTSGGPVLSY